MMWISFFVLLILSLVFDLGILEKKSKALTTKQALGRTLIWVSLALSYSIVVYFAYKNNWVENPHGLSGRSAFFKFITGYIVEQSLSMDNIFVIAVIFKFFRIPKELQHRVLFWGILGALVFRGIMIAIGVVLIERFDWIMYVFGLLLLYSAYKMWRSHDAEIHPDKNPVITFFRRFFPVTSELKEEHFFVKQDHVWAATPLFIALLVIESTDIMFAFDSIPAIFAITTDAFIVFTSNIFAILGLRSLYFVLAAILDRFTYLQYSLIIVLAFIGVKLLIHDFVDLPEWLSLAVILTFISGGIAFSLIVDKKKSS